MTSTAVTQTNPMNKVMTPDGDRKATAATSSLADKKPKDLKITTTFTDATSGVANPAPITTPPSIKATSTNSDAVFTFHTEEGIQTLNEEQADVLLEFIKLPNADDQKELESYIQARKKIAKKEISGAFENAKNLKAPYTVFGFIHPLLGVSNLSTQQFSKVLEMARTLPDEHKYLLFLENRKNNTALGSAIQKEFDLGAFQERAKKEMHLVVLGNRVEAVFNSLVNNFETLLGQNRLNDEMDRIVVLVCNEENRAKRSEWIGKLKHIPLLKRMVFDEATLFHDALEFGNDDSREVEVMELPIYYKYSISRLIDPNVFSLLNFGRIVRKMIPEIRGKESKVIQILNDLYFSVIGVNEGNPSVTESERKEVQNSELLMNSFVHRLFEKPFRNCESTADKMEVCLQYCFSGIMLVVVEHLQGIEGWKKRGFGVVPARSLE